MKLEGPPPGTVRPVGHNERMSDDNPSAEQPPPPPHAVPTSEEPPQDYRWLQTEFIKESPRLPAPTPPDVLEK